MSYVLEFRVIRLEGCAPTFTGIQLYHLSNSFSSIKTQFSIASGPIFWQKISHDSAHSSLGVPSHMWHLLPTRAQWRQWSLPSKLTCIGAYAGVLSILLFFLWP